MLNIRKIQKIENVESPEFGSDLINRLDEIQTERQVSQNLGRERKNLRQPASGSVATEPVMPVLKRIRTSRRSGPGMGTGYQEVPPCSAAQNVSLIVLSLVRRPAGRGSLTFAAERQVRHTLSRSAGSPQWRRGCHAIYLR